MYDCDLSISDKEKFMAAFFATKRRPHIRFDPNRDGVGLGRWVVFTEKDSDEWIVHAQTLPEAIGICYGNFHVSA